MRKPMIPSITTHMAACCRNFGSTLTSVTLILALGSFCPTPARGEDRPAASGLPVNRGVGQRLSNFTLTDVVNHRPVSLYGFAGKKAAVLVFLGADCPLANLYVPRLVELDREFRGKGVA